MFATFAVTILLATAPAPIQAGATQTHDQVSHSSKPCAMCAAHHETGAAQARGETRRDNPHSTVVEEESAVAVHSPTNAEINAAETGNPASVDFAYRQAGGTIDDAQWEALEAGNPHAVTAASSIPVAVAVSSPTVKCRCMASNAH